MVSLYKGYLNLIQALNFLSFFIMNVYVAKQTYQRSRKVSNYSFHNN